MYKLPSKLKNYRQRYILVFTLSNVLAKYFRYIRCSKTTSIKYLKGQVYTWPFVIKEEIMNSDIQSIIASVGFPIALSMYLLVRIEGKLQTLTDSINEFTKNIISMR